MLRSSAFSRFIGVRIFYNGLLLFLSFLVTLLVFELVYRGYVHFQKPLHRPSSFPNLGWELTPGAKLIEDNIEGTPVSYLVNLSGFRDITNGPWNKWGVDNIKVAYIGDSITYGVGVEYGDTYCSVVESTFSKTTLSVRTANLGISGFNTLQHLANLRYKAFPLNPDIIILQYFPNDIERRKTQELPGIIQYVLRHYHFGTFLIGRIATALENRKVKIPANLISTMGDESKMQSSCGGYTKRIINEYGTTAWKYTKAAILSMSEMCLQKGVKFAVVVFPFEAQIKGNCPYTPQEMLGSFLSMNGIPFLDIADTYEKHISETKLYLEGDNMHPSNLGHRVAGEVISSWLTSDPEFREIFGVQK